MHLSIPQLNLSRAMLIWSCVKNSLHLNLSCASKFQYCVFSAGPKLNICPKVFSLSHNWTTGNRGSLFLLPIPVCALPNFQLFFNWTKGSLFLLPIPVNAPKYSSVESFSCNVDMKLHPKFPQCPSIGPMVACFYYQHLYTRFHYYQFLYLHLSVPQLNLSCAMLIWSCLQNFLNVPQLDHW